MQRNTAELTRTESHDLDLDSAVAAVVAPVCGRIGLRHSLKGQHLHAVMLDMVSLDANGANAAELMAYGLALMDLARTLTSQHADDTPTVERLQLHADLRDDQMIRSLPIEGRTPSMLESAADALDACAAANAALARCYRKEARQARVTSATARQRFGLNGAA